MTRLSSCAFVIVGGLGFMLASGHDDVPDDVARRLAKLESGHKRLANDLRGAEAVVRELRQDVVRLKDFCGRLEQSQAVSRLIAELKALRTKLEERATQTERELPVAVQRLLRNALLEELKANIGKKAYPRTIHVWHPLSKWKGGGSSVRRFTELPPPLKWPYVLRKREAPDSFRSFLAKLKHVGASSATGHSLSELEALRASAKKSLVAADADLRSIRGALRAAELKGALLDVEVDLSYRAYRQAFRGKPPAPRRPRISFEMKPER